MKYFILLFMLCAFSVTRGQDSLIVKDGITEINEINGAYAEGLFVNIPITNASDILSEWKKKLKNDSKGTISEKKSVIRMSKSVLAAISPDSIYLHTEIKNANSPQSGTDMMVFISRNDSSWSRQNVREIFDRLNSYMRNFAVSQYKNAVANELTIESKKLNEMKEDEKKMERDDESNKKRIVSAKSDNEKLQEKIDANYDIIDTKSSEIAQQSNTVSDMPQSDQRLDEEKKLKQMQKEKQKLLDEKDSMKKKIEKNNSEIDDLQKKVDLNLSSNIPNKKENIGKQEEVVKNLQQKLNSIR